MEKTIIKESTLQYANNVLKKQKTFTDDIYINLEKDAQKAYYKGLKDMLEIIKTDAYTN